MNIPRTVRPDAKGRITLGHLADGVSGFRVEVDEKHRVILEPLVEISASEQWVFNNPKVLRQLQKGIEDSARGRVTKRDFSMSVSRQKK